MNSRPTLLWFRNDLRVTDNPALRKAIKRGGPVIPVFIWAPDEEAPWPPGAASRWWLHQSLQALSASLEKRKNRLLIRSGCSLAILRALIKETGAESVYFNRRYEPAVAERDDRLTETLSEDGIEVKHFNASLLHEPWEIENKQGKPFQVFTPFWRHCLNKPEPPQPEPAPRSIPSPSPWPVSDPLESLELLPKIDWAGEIAQTWTPGEKGAHRMLDQFLDESMLHYPDGRDRPDTSHTSRLSPYLHFGELSPRSIWHAAKKKAMSVTNSGLVLGADEFLREIGWREFAYHLLHHFPHTDLQPLRDNFKHFPWKQDPEGLKAWQKGRTGYPIVDAGMRQLWRTGWMHNRVRMIVASFLIKDLLIPWQEGARWFWDTLVDADLANNTSGWQWTAGSGADAAPYFRIFNPISQGEKFDPKGRYVRTYVPELSPLPDKWIHRPWQTPTAILRQSGMALGTDYPHPIVNHAEARDRALAGYEMVRTKPK